MENELIFALLEKGVSVFIAVSAVVGVGWLMKMLKSELIAGHRTLSEKMDTIQSEFVTILERLTRMETQIDHIMHSEQERRH
tara:strand:+ start:1751 stop:1996 length:246 start_codon:yes stop_codon:yes gene_type:complete